MLDRWEAIVLKTFSEEERQDWINTLRLKLSSEFPEYYRELQGIVGWHMKPEDWPQPLLDNLILFNAIYELGSPVFCSGLLMADPNGRVF